MYDFLWFLGQLLLRRSPLLILVLAGCVFAVLRWRRHPRVSLMTVLALVILIVESFAFAFVYRWLPSWFYEMGATRAGYNIIEIGLSLIDDSIFAGVLLLLVAAAFTGRRAEPRVVEP